MSDIDQAVRGLKKRPGFTLLTVATLGIGIGASTAVFSAVHAVLLRPLPYPDADRAVVLFHEDVESGERGNGLSPANARDLRERSSLLAEVAVAETWGAGLQLDGRSESLRAWRVSEGFFEALGVEPMLGRLFVPEEYQPGREPIIVLGHRSWSARFGADTALVGTTVNLEGETVTVAGVLPHDFELPDEAEFWMPRPPEPYDDRQRSADYMMGLARLAEGATLEAARSELQAIALELAVIHPETNARRGFSMIPLREHLVGDVRTPLLVLFAAVGFVLLISCANVAGLMLARGVRRRRDYALRSALGASRTRLVGHMAVETSLLALGGCVLGLGLAFLGLDVIRALAPDHLPRIQDLRLDGTALAFALASSALSAVVSGLAPSTSLLGAEGLTTLADAGRGATPSRGSLSSGRRLVVAEVAAAMVLVVGAGLLAKSFSTLLDGDLGFQPENRLALQTFAYTLDGPDALDAFIRDVREGMGAIPGVRGVAVTSSVPGATDGVLASIDINLPFTLEDGPAPPPGQEPTAAISQVSHDFFDVLGMRLVSGRGFAEADESRAPLVVVVNETLARRHFGDGPVIGRRIVIGYQPVPREIVGVVADVRPQGHESDPRPEVYFPLRQFPTTQLTFVLRAEVDAALITGAARDAVWAADPSQAVWGTATLESLLGDWLAERRFNLFLLGAFAGVALLLASIGVYGMLSFSVEQRMAELGIRRVLGGGSGSILGMVLGEGLRLAGIGIVLGGVGALVLARFIRSMLYGIAPTDPATLVGVATVVLGVAALASFLPAIRAVRQDPMTVLRDE
ncbi:MAG TPA: ABC transporter permease [Longimicrobiales bacterium]|nr:ABC transporter permease [Longimicrobiales bacterium]